MRRTLASQPDFETPVKTGRKVSIDSQGGKRARRQRTAVTELSIGRVELQPPKDRPADGPVAAWAVRVLETEPPAGHEPLAWLLVSSEGGPTAAWAERIVGWYEARWEIEEYFRVLKSGTRIEDRRLQDADALVKCLAFDAVTAWRVCSLDRYVRDAPDTPAAEVLTGDERQVIGAVVRAEGLLPPAERGKPFPPDIRSWVVLLARMAGWCPSKRRHFAVQRPEVADAATVQALPRHGAQLVLCDVQPTPVFRRVAELEATDQLPGPGRLEHFVEGPLRVRVEVVAHQGDLRAFGVAPFQQPGDLHRPVRLRTPGPGRRLPPTRQRFAEQEDRGGAGPFVFVVDAAGALLRDGNRRAGLLDQLHRLLIHAHDGACRVVRSRIDVQNLLHVRHELGIGLRRDHPVFDFPPG